MIALGLGDRNEGMWFGELRPRHRQHFGRGIQLHRAGAERNHGRVQAQILSLEVPDEPHHLQLGSVAVEDGMGQKWRGSPQARRVWGHLGRGPDLTCPPRPESTGEDAGEGVHVSLNGRLIERHVDRAVVAVPQVHPRVERRLPQACRVGTRHVQRVEVGVVQQPQPEARQLALETGGMCVDPAGNGRQSFRAVKHREKRGHVRQERLGRADVRSRFLAADVLLPGLKRHAVRGVPCRIDGHANHPARGLTHMRFEGRKECRMRAAIPHRHTEALRIAQDDVRTELTGRSQQRQAEQVGRHRHEDAVAFRLGNELAQIVHAAGLIRRLNERAKRA